MKTTTITARQAWRQYSAFRRANGSNLDRTARHAAVPAPSMEASRLVWASLDIAYQRGSLQPDLLAQREPGQFAHFAQLRAIFC